MSRHQQHTSQNALVFAVVALLVILVLLPMRWTRWLDGLRELATTVVAPVSHPVSNLGAWLRPARANDQRTQLEAQLERELEDWRRQYLRVRDENQALRDRIRDLQSGVAVAPAIGVRQLSVPVIGRSAGLGGRVLTIRAGSRAGVVPGSVAVADGVQLVGVVREVGTRISSLVPLTDPSVGRVQGVVMVDADGQRVLGCSLTPLGDGTLRGPVGVLAGSESLPGDAESLDSEIAVGQLVRLHDRDGWPASAQMLILGRVERIERASDSRLRSEVVVRPTLAIQRVSEVVLRIPLESPAVGGSAGSGGRGSADTAEGGRP